MKGVNVVLCLFLIAHLSHGYKKVECIVKNILSEVSMSDTIVQSIENYKNEKDFSQEVIITSENQYKYLYHIDLQTQLDIENLLRNYIVQNDSFKRAVAGCNLSMNRVFKSCIKKYKEGCEMLHPFAAVRKCPKNYYRLGFQYCVPLCPSGFDGIENDGFSCSKNIKSNRSETFSENFHTTLINYKNLFWMYDCPSNYQRINNDVCIRKCPFGWEDLGDRCKKPHVDLRKYEAFYYKFEYDDDEIETELHKFVAGR